MIVVHGGSSATASAMNDNKKVMRVLVSEDKSFKVPAKSKRHSIVGNRCVNGLHVATSLSQKEKEKKGMFDNS